MISRSSTTIDNTFYPPRRLGMFFHAGSILLLLGAGAYGLYQATRAQVGPVFILALLPVILAGILVPLLATRALALRSAAYVLDRDGLRLKWGGRIEEIPMTAIQWVRPEREVREHLPLPWVYWPGSVLGSRRFGAVQVEFMSAATRNLMLVGTTGRIYAISPAKSETFLATFRRLSELGSLSPIAPRSVQPEPLIGRVWAVAPARWLVLSGLVFCLALLVWVSLAIPGLEQVSLGFQVNGLAREPVPAIQFLLLPVLGLLIYFSDLLLGMIFFRQDEKHPLAYLLWLGGAILPLAFLIDVFVILSRA